MPRFEVKHFR